MWVLGNLILNTSCEFNCDDVTVTSAINTIYGHVQVCCHCKYYARNSIRSVIRILWPKGLYSANAIQT